MSRRTFREAVADLRQEVSGASRGSWTILTIRRPDGTVETVRSDMRFDARMFAKAVAATRAAGRGEILVVEPAATLASQRTALADALEAALEPSGQPFPARTGPAQAPCAAAWPLPRQHWRPSMPPIPKWPRAGMPPQRRGRTHPSKQGTEEHHHHGFVAEEPGRRVAGFRSRRGGG